MSLKLLFTVIFVSLLLAAGLLGYRLFYQDPVASNAVAESGAGVLSQALLNNGGNSNGQIDAEALEYARLLRVIGTITSIDRSIFDRPAFLSLFNFTATIPNPAPGRSNPFAPVGAP